jgi:hypothetical protein
VTVSQIGAFMAVFDVSNVNGIIGSGGFRAMPISR